MIFIIIFNKILYLLSINKLISSFLKAFTKSNSSFTSIFRFFFNIFTFNPI